MKSNTNRKIEILKDELLASITGGMATGSVHVHIYAPIEKHIMTEVPADNVMKHIKVNEPG